MDQSIPPRVPAIQQHKFTRWPISDGRWTQCPLHGVHAQADDGKEPFDLHQPTIPERSRRSKRTKQYPLEAIRQTNEQ
jgi:hypothetical protein